MPLPERGRPEVCPGYPDVPVGNGTGTDPIRVPDAAPGLGSSEYAIEDTVRVPAGIAAGEYVLAYWWDCEKTTQIWQSCSDISIE